MLYLLQYALILAAPYKKHYRWYGVSMTIIIILGLIGAVVAVSLKAQSDCDEPKDIPLAKVLNWNIALFFVTAGIVPILAHLLYFLNICGSGEGATNKQTNAVQPVGDQSQNALKEPDESVRRPEDVKTER